MYLYYYTTIEDFDQIMDDEFIPLPVDGKFLLWTTKQKQIGIEIKLFGDDLELKDLGNGTFIGDKPIDTNFICSVWDYEICKCIYQCFGEKFVYFVRHDPNVSSIFRADCLGIHVDEQIPTNLFIHFAYEYASRHDMINLNWHLQIMLPENYYIQMYNERHDNVDAHFIKDMTDIPFPDMDLAKEALQTLRDNQSPDYIGIVNT